MAKSEEPRYGLGIDLGGTKILAGIIDLDKGTVIATAKKKTRTKQGTGELLTRMGDAAQEALATAKLKEGAVASIGVAAAGQVDPERGVLIAAPNLGGLANIPIAESLGGRFGLPVRLGNDVQGAALGELHFGAAHGVARSLCVFVGTGVGGALINGGVLDSGPNATAGEIGHLIVHADGRFCGCGGRGHLEAYASRTAMTRRLQEELRRGRPSILRDLLKAEGADDNAPGGTAIRSSLLAEALKEDDELTLEVLHEAVRFLAYGLTSAINLYNPARIIIGGGVVEAVPTLVDLVRPIALREALPAAARGIEIVPSQLGDDAGIVGAAILGASKDE